MKYEIVNAPAGPVLVLRDQVTFSDRVAFESVLDRLIAPGAGTVTVDLEQLDYMDSAGLGMLVTLRGRAEKGGARVVLRKPRGDVKELLALACFETLFTIEHG